MVDFQERDTTRGLSSEDEDEEDGASETAEEVEDSGSKGGDGGERSETSTPGATIKSGGAEGGVTDADAHSHEGEHDHDHHAHDLETVRTAVVTISSTRTIDDDTAGEAIASAMEDDGAEIATRDLVRDDFDNVQAAVDALVGRGDVDVVITTGGTGVSPDDVTVEAIRPLFEKELNGFGELFRRLSYEEIGTKVVGSRATAGIADGVPVFCLPGSESAARLGTEEIIVEQASHLAGLASRE